MRDDLEVREEPSLDLPQGVRWRLGDQSPSVDSTLDPFALSHDVVVDIKACSFCCYGYLDG